MVVRFNPSPWADFLSSVHLYQVDPMSLGLGDVEDHENEKEMLSKQVLIELSIL